MKWLSFKKPRPSGASSLQEESAARDRVVQRDLFAWSLLAGVVLLAVLAGPFFAGRVYTRDDLGAFHLPTRAFYAEQLQRGEPFDWMPSLFSGFYLTGEGQAGTYHPAHLLLYRLLPLRAAMAWEWLLPYPMMLGGMFLLLRRRLHRADAAMFGAVLFTFSTFNLLHFVHPNAIAVVAHIPWLLWTLDIILVEAGRRRVALAAAGYALLTGSQLLVGYPQYVWFSLLTEAAFVAFVALRRRYEPRAGCLYCANCGDCVGCDHLPWSRVALAKLCGLLIGWVQVLPTVDALAHAAQRGAGSVFAESGSLNPANLLQLLAPYWFTDRVIGTNTHESSVYLGAVPLVLIVWLFARRKRLGREAALVAATAGFAAFALVMALGKYAGLYRLQTWLPLIGSFRFPCRYLVLFQLGVAVLAAFGFTLLVREYRESRSRRESAKDTAPPRSRFRELWNRFEPLWLVAIASLVIALIGLPNAGSEAVNPWPAVMAGPLLFAVAVGFTATAACGHRWALVGLVLFAAADLGLYGASYGIYPSSERLDHYVKRIHSPPGPQSRIVTDALRFGQPGPRWGNQVTLTGARRADGYAGLEPGQRLPLDSIEALRVAGVDWVRRSERTERIAGLIHHDAHWLRVPSPLPRARLVADVKVSEHPHRALKQVDVAKTAIVEARPKREPAGDDSFPAGPTGSVELVHDRPGCLRMTVDCPARRLLVISERFHPGWRAVIDGQPQPVIRVNGDFIGCVVGPGSQHVELTFSPRSLRWGRMVSMLGLALTAVCCFVHGRKKTVRSER